MVSLRSCLLLELKPERCKSASMVLLFFHAMLLFISAAMISALDLVPMSADAHSKRHQPLPHAGSIELLNKRDVGAYCFPVAGCANGAEETTAGQAFGHDCKSIRVRSGYLLCTECKYTQLGCHHFDTCIDLTTARVKATCVMPGEYAMQCHMGKCHLEQQTDIDPHYHQRRNERRKRSSCGQDFPHR